MCVCVCVCVFSFPFGLECGMWDLIVLLPDHCLSFQFLRCYPYNKKCYGMKQMPPKAAWLSDFHYCFLSVSLCHFIIKFHVFKRPEHLDISLQIIYSAQYDTVDCCLAEELYKL